MDKMTMVAMVMLIAPGVRAQEERVSVCMDGGSDFLVLDSAKTIASKMFNAIGVQIDWHIPGKACTAGAIVVSQSFETSDLVAPGALACAMPFQGFRIEVFMDRIRSRVGQQLTPHVLAHVLVHEIAHILQGVNSHSSNGVMKAQWDSKDYVEMAKRHLPFAKEDVDRIHKGMLYRRSRLVSGAQELKITVFLYNYGDVPDDILQPAVLSAKNMFGKAGIGLEIQTLERWRYDPGALVVQIYKGRSANPKLKNVSGAAAITAGTPPFLANVFFANIEARAATAKEVSLILSHVIAHELAHLLGLKHAKGTLMTEEPNGAEMLLLKMEQLHFSDSEARQMRAAVIARRPVP